MPCSMSVFAAARPVGPAPINAYRGIPAAISIPCNVAPSRHCCRAFRTRSRDDDCLSRCGSRAATAVFLPTRHNDENKRKNLRGLGGGCRVVFVKKLVLLPL